MQETLTPKKGYVYILTNPSFKEDWIKIGKSVRPVDVRSKELDNTAVPLPFEIYATMKTSSYNKIEKMLHVFLEGTGKRIRKNREFFNINPEFALEAFRAIADLLDDAEVYLNGEEPQVIQLPKEIKQKQSKPKPRPNLVEVHPNDDLIKNDRYTLDGEHFYSMAKFAYYFIKHLIDDNPSLSFAKLEAMFPKDMLTGYRYCGVLVKKDTLENANISPAVSKKAYRVGEENSLLRNPLDGVDFYVTTQWMRESFKNLLSIARKQGYKVYRVTKL